MLLYVNRYKWVVDWIFVIVRAISLYTTFYIVSIHLMLLFIGVIFNSCRWCKRFNTSHVTLYLVRGLCSCSACRVSIHLMLLFIRFQRWFTCPGIVSIHLMLLFICRTRRTWNISRSVSIHLILLFIEETGSAEKKLQPFQYISCYSLSEMSDGTQGNGLVSIHLMLLFISIRLVSSISAQSVSIHLMLLFI